jgi:hypothetical protein
MTHTTVLLQEDFTVLLSKQCTCHKQKQQKNEIFFETNTFPDKKCTCSLCDFGYSEKKENPGTPSSTERKEKRRVEREIHEAEETESMVSTEE